MMAEEKPQGEKMGLSEDEIHLLESHARETMCADSVNEILKKYNCIFNPVCHISNSGSHVEIKVIALAYSVGPDGKIEPAKLN
jgi:hypothetical protein